MHLNFNSGTVIYGGPGTGKTERLISIVEQELTEGVPPHEIAYVSFTRRAVHEARQRAIDRFALVKEELEGFRTVHSMAYAGVNVTRGDMMAKADYIAFGQLLGVTFKEREYNNNAPISLDAGDAYRHLYSLCRATWMDPRSAWEKYGMGLGWWPFLQFVQTLEHYKADINKVDFADLLNTYAEQGTVRDYQVGVVDEAQDLSAAQWHVLQRAFERCERVYIAGDDDQSINTWAGADPTTFRDISHTEGVSVEILSQSHRVPKKIFNVAQKILERIETREWKHYVATGEEGAVHQIGSPAHAPLEDGEWLVLARNHYHLTPIFDLVRARGLAYRTQEGSSIDSEHVEVIKTWERLRMGRAVDGSSITLVAGYAKQKLETPLDEMELYSAASAGLDVTEIWHDALTLIPPETRAYYLTVRRNGGLLDSLPRILISTIHGSKGAEADNVLLLTDTSKRASLGMEQDADAEHRVWYVGVTRPREKLWVVAPQGKYFYQVPL